MNYDEPWKMGKLPTSARGDFTIVSGNEGAPILYQTDCEGMYICQHYVERSIACVNALEGLNPEGVPAVVKALELLMRCTGFTEWAQSQRSVMENDALNACRASLTKIKQQNF